MSNLDEINNFILYITSASDAKDEKFNEAMSFTPKVLYDLAKDYVDSVEENLLRVWTYFDGTASDVGDFVREWETLLDTIVTADLTSDSDGNESWYCEAFVTQEQIDEFNMDEDWFTIQ